MINKHTKRLNCTSLKTSQVGWHTVNCITVLLYLDPSLCACNSLMLCAAPFDVMRGTFWCCARHPLILTSDVSHRQSSKRWCHFGRGHITVRPSTRHNKPVSPFLCTLVISIFWISWYIFSYLQGIVTTRVFRWRIVLVYLSSSLKLPLLSGIKKRFISLFRRSNSNLIHT